MSDKADKSVVDLEEEDKLIQQEYQALINDYLNSNHRKKVDIIEKAFEFAKEAHKGVRRRSGEPYIMHPIAVARIVSKEIGLGSTSICAALLHDVVEDTEYTVEDISNIFNPKIAYIVDGLTKISSGMFGTEVSEQAENFRKLLLTMSNDVRVILIKIADRLHNMRTLGSMPPAKQYKISGETMYLYAPLAHRLGLFAIKTELEELSFKWENPEIYEDLKQKVEATRGERDDLYQIFAKPIVEALDRTQFKYEIKARDKSIYSIWNKMQTKGVPFEEIYDLFAVRIIFDSEAGLDEKKRCWDIYSVVTDIYKLRPDRIRDWVSRPKANGYQALHLTVMGPKGYWIEVQIRSQRMHEIAEKGFAAHWKYKEGGVEEDTELDQWLKTIKEILENPSPNALDFLDTIKLNLFSQEIFVFTPKGELKTLAQGASALDYAYTIHSKVGDHAIGAKVNYKLVPISHILSSGDQVEILTSKTAYPKEEWKNFVTTAKAKSKIDYALKRRRRQVVNQGKEILEEAFVLAEVELTQDVVNAILHFYNKENIDDLYFAIGDKEIHLPEKKELLKYAKKGLNDNVLVKYMKQMFNVVSKKDNKVDAIPSAPIVFEKLDTKKTYVVDEDLLNKNFEIASCCRPIPGDKIFGFITSNNKVMVHNINCKEGVKMKANYGNRILDLKWRDRTDIPFLVKLNISGIDRMGIVRDLTQKLIDSSFNIKSIHVDSKDGVFVGYVVLGVTSTKDIQSLSKQLTAIDGVNLVARVSS